MQFVLFLPQMRMTAAQIVERAQAAEQAGFHGIAFMDHLTPPLAGTQPMHEAMQIATWVAAHTTTLHVSHLVLCDAFRHPAVLARECVSLQEMSGGRFELGIGSGSWQGDFDEFGVEPATPRQRTDRFGETLAVLRALWSGQTFDFEGDYHRMTGAQQQPVPEPAIPIVIGGAGPRTMKLVAEHAEWWNVPIHRLDRLATMRHEAGQARISVQEMIAFVPHPMQRAQIEGLALQRFAGSVAGRIYDASQTRDHLAGLGEQGVERHYTWFTDFADPATLRAFGDQVIASL